MHINLDLYENIDDIQDIVNELLDLKARVTSMHDANVLSDTIDILEQIITENEY